MRSFVIALLLAQDPPKQDKFSAEPAALEEEKIWMAAAEQAVPKTVLVEFKLSEDSYAPVGSGAIVTADGYVATCAHVAEAIEKQVRARDCAVRTMDGRRHAAKILGMNSANDIAILKFDGKDLPHFELADRAIVKKGERVMALGFPMGNVGLGRSPAKDVHPSLALGEVAEPAVPFFIMSPGAKKYYPDAVESDTPVFMGNSGGPLVNRTGELVGLNAAIIPTTNKTYTLSVGSIARAFPRLKQGQNVDGAQPELSSAAARLGKTLWDAFGANFSFSHPEPTRTYLNAPFEKAARARRGGVARLLRGETTVGFATLIDERGHAITSLHVVDRTNVLDKAFEQLEKRVGAGGKMREFLKSAKEYLDDTGELIAELQGGQKAAVQVLKKSLEQKVALIHIGVPRAQKTAFIPKLVKGARGPGQWVAAAGDELFGVGLLSTDRHTVRGALRVPTSLREAWDVIMKDSKGLEGNDLTNVILHDIPLRYDQLGSPLLDSRGRLVGINIYHACRGVSYAVRIDVALKALDVDSGL